MMLEPVLHAHTSRFLPPTQTAAAAAIREMGWLHTRDSELHAMTVLTDVALTSDLAVFYLADWLHTTQLWHRQSKAFNWQLLILRTGCPFYKQ